LPELAGAARAAALRVAEALARACAAALGRAVAAVILHGSLTLDDYVPGHSDVDLLVVVDEPLGDAQVAALTEALASRRAEAPGPVDLRVVTLRVAASPTPTPPMEAYLRLTPTSGVRLEERRHAGERDLVVELSVCRAHGRSLLGGAPTELIGEVPDRWVVAAGDAQLADWQAIGDDPPYAELTVLTACRVWRFATEGRPRRCNGCWRWSEHDLPRHDANELRSIPRDIEDCLEGVAGRRLVAGALRDCRQEPVDGGSEPAGVGDRKAVAEAGQPGPQPGQAAGRAPILLVVRRQRRRRQHQPRPAGVQAEVGHHVTADQHPVPRPPERQRAERVPWHLQHLKSTHQVALC
jgi:predicted nucleotidyltransferase